ncbi:MAG: DUF3043 domain-containing protein [Micrococcales bacterium]
MTEDAPKTKAAGKGKATPSRKVAEAKNVRPLVASKAKITDPEAKKAAKAALAEERLKARQGMADGDDRYLSIRDRGPQKRLARSIVDSRFTVGESLIPVMALVLIAGIVFPTTGDLAMVGYVVNASVLLLMWALLAGIVIDAWLIGRKVNKAALAKFGKVERGLAMYAGLRSTQLRYMRLPKHGK